MQLLARVIIFLLFISTGLNCSSGWSVSGYELSPMDTSMNTVFIEVLSHDSTEHWYAHRVYHGDNWCHLHDKWEYVEVK
jgi:hypothetical protein